ncbi:hypothetical protein G6045_39530 [Streptomyces sp. YC504]|uniref:Uncharacterized protein n=1 Tax=Streptomyces mesophilus TaxID=1775132 RepID=A0A6G4XVR4_9ACTN|nr:hypothetical protein [Streptomyces mesophilus]NGO81699.1 hypothetical protein [Streptomyces mesophilus]
MDASTRAGLILAAVTALVTLALTLLHRFTDVPLRPGRRPTGERTAGDQPAGERPFVDWESAPDLPEFSYAALYALAVRRRDALARAVRCAREADLPVPEPLGLLPETRGQAGPQEGAYAVLALAAADEFIEESLPPDSVPTAGQLDEFEQRTGGTYDRRLEEGIALTDVVAALEVSRIGMRALICLTEGTALTLDRPCYFHPLHERGTERVPWPQDAFTAEDPGHALVDEVDEVDEVDDEGDEGDKDDDVVAACPACAAGTPAPLLVRTEAGEVPYYLTEFETKSVFQTSGYGAGALSWDADDLLRAFVEWHTFETDDDRGDTGGAGRAGGVGRASGGQGDTDDRTEATA